MPIVLRGTVKFDENAKELGEYYLAAHGTNHDEVSRILEKYNGKNIDMVISIREASNSIHDAPDGCRREASRF